MKIHFHFGITLAAMFVLSSCKQFGFSELKHDFGQTKNPRQTALNPCQVTEADSSGYLKSIFDKITKSNPETFQGVYDPARFCLNLSMNQELNAFALPNSGTIFINAGLILAAESDATIASVMAHELAHVTMQSMIAPLENKFKTLASDPKIVEFAQRESAIRMVKMKAQKVLSEATKNLATAKENFYQSLSGTQRSEFNIAITKSEQIRLEETSKLSKKYEDLFASLFHNKGLNDEERKKRNDDLRKQSDSEFEDLSKRQKEADASSEAVAIKFAADNAFGKTWMAAERAKEKAAEAFNNISNTSNAMSAELEGMAPSILGGGVLFNWHEQEADEIGLELYVRAGFDSDQFVTFLNTLMRVLESKEVADECMKFVASFKSGDKPPFRGNETHPSNCWRAYNTVAIELKAHAADYANIEKQLVSRGEKKLVNLPQSGLAALQAELRTKLGNKVK